MSEPLRALQAEAKADPAGVVVPLVTDDGTVEILVPPPAMWFEGAVEALTRGRTTDWIALALEGDELAKWQSVRKRYRDIDTFFHEWTRLAGEDPKGSQGSKGSSKGTRKR